MGGAVALITKNAECSQVDISAGSLYVRLRGPFPRAVVEAADSSKQFSGRSDVIRWLDAAWPEWRLNVVEGVFL